MRWSCEPLILGTDLSTISEERLAIIENKGQFAKIEMHIRVLTFIFSAHRNPSIAFHQPLHPRL